MAATPFAFGAVRLSVPVIWASFSGKSIGEKPLGGNGKCLRAKGS